MRRILIAALIASLSSLAWAGGFKLSSPDIKPGKMIPQRFEFNSFGCSGENKSPVLKWSGAPKGTRSFALTLYDPDAPTGSGWWHWVVINIPARVHKLPANAGAADGSLLPKGASQMRNDYGTQGYGGTCPPKGAKPHHYIFTLFALKTDKLKIPAHASLALTGYMIRANALAQARFVARYGRGK